MSWYTFKLIKTDIMSWQSKQLIEGDKNNTW